MNSLSDLFRIDKMPANAETAQEVKFWLELDGELRHIEEQLKTEEAECTLGILKQAKRFITTASFDTDTIGLKKAIKKGASTFNLMFILNSRHLQEHDEGFPHQSTPHIIGD